MGSRSATPDGQGAALSTSTTTCFFPRFCRAAAAKDSDQQLPAQRRQPIKVTRIALTSRSALGTDDEAKVHGVVKTAWAVLLRLYTGQDDVCFSFSADCDEAIVAFDFCDADISVADAVASAKTPTGGSTIGPTTAGRWGRTIPQSDRDVPAAIDTAVLVTSGRNASGLGSVPKLKKHQNLRLLVKTGGPSIGLFLEWDAPALGMSAAQGNLVTDTLSAILSAILDSAPEAPLRDLDSLGPANRTRLVSWNEASPVDPVERCVHHIIADHVAQQPDAEAVCAWDGSLTYLELDRAAARLAARLVGCGVGPEVLVPLCFDKSKWTVVAMLAVLKAGGAFVPLDASHPVERLAGLCDSLGATTMVCSGRLVDKLSPVVHTVIAGDDVSLDDCVSDSAVEVDVSSSNAAYVIFTSGSTGTPKGTVIEHRSFCSSARAHAPALRIDNTCRVLQFAAATFDASLVEILTPLMSGGCVCIPSEEERLNDLAGAINRMGVNHAVLTPSFVGFLTPAAVPGLRRLVLAGEAMAHHHVATWSHIELINGFGPSEASVCAVANSRVTPGTDPKDIGVPCGVRVWLVNPDDHDTLVPVGCVGEMLLEGPSLARGYLNDAAKTADSFISDPAWVGAGAGRRFYKTGDLARYSSDSGSLTYVGRKDTQVKLHGQRIELGEVEYFVAVDERVRHALVILPKNGPLKGRLVSVLSLAGEDDSVARSAEEQPCLVSNLSAVESAIAGVRRELSTRLPEYMVPSVWLPVDAIPMLASRKMNRKAVSMWVEAGLSVEQCQELIMGSHGAEPHAQPSEEHSTAAQLTDTEMTLRNIWGTVLNLPADQIHPDSRSFLNLGGDSISAMTCASRAKKAGLAVAVRDILRAESLRQLASRAVPLDNIVKTNGQSDGDEGLNVPFTLSPIQELHFATRGTAQGDEHFNQSFCLRVTRRIAEDDLRRDLQTIVRRHGMLRSRFFRGEDGQWRQCISGDVDGSFRLRAHSVTTQKDMDAGIADAQGCLDVQNGPLLAAELFEREDAGDQTIFMAVNHLVIDLVSWRVILEDLEDIFSCSWDENATHPSLSFPTWTALQQDEVANLPLDHLGPANLSEPQPDYWGLANRPNLYGDVVCENFALDARVSQALLADCHTPFRTETVDLLLTALAWSFGTVFTDRPLPTIFNEGHGREPLLSGADLDISRTVGWFTTLFPVCLPPSTSFAQALVQIKDLRRRAPGNGRPYFAARPNDAKAMEVSFNFLGRYQQLERAGGLFQPAEGSIMAGEAHAGSPTADFGAAATRFALFEISAVVVHGVLRFGFAWNGGMRHQERIRQWVAACRRALEEAAATLPAMPRVASASDFPLLLGAGLTASDVEEFGRTHLAGLAGEKGWDGIEDIYPASPIQQGLLMSRTKTESFYAVRRVLRVTAAAGGVDVSRAARAWEDVVRRHAMLRTVFVDSLGDVGGYDQVVLTEARPSLLNRKYDTEKEMHEALDALEPMHYQESEPQHRLTMLHADDSNAALVCVLEMSHAIMDGASMDILLRDFGRAYAGSLATASKPLFSPFVASLQQRSREHDLLFWKSRLAGLEPCHFPVLNDGVSKTDARSQLKTLRVELPQLAALQRFCDKGGFTLPNALAAAWALTLGLYTGADDVCFGYLASGRDGALVRGSDEAVGPFVNMATHRISLAGPDTSIINILEAVQRDQLECMPYAQVSLAEVQHALHLPGGMPLFNTCISYRRVLPSRASEMVGLLFEDIKAQEDPTEYPLSLNMEVDDAGRATIDIDYWTDSIACGQAEHIAATFMQAVSNIAENATVPASRVVAVHPSTLGQIWEWNRQIPATTAECLHRMVEKQVAIRPDAEAVHGWDASFSYREMNSLADRLACHLAEVGVGPEVFVPVCFDKSAWTVVAMLAVLKAGGAVVPLDAGHPIDALQDKVLDVGAHVVVASASRAAMFDSMVPYVVAVGPDLLSGLSDSAGDEVETEATPENAAWVIFTSGSTGKPKAVVLEHQALVSSALAHGARLGLGPDTRFLQFAALTFDNSIEEMFTNLIHGGCVCVPSDADRLGNLAGAINALGANFMDLTPTVAALLHPSQVPGIKALAVGGEALTQTVLDAWGGVVPVHNQYGPSECSINATHRLHKTARGDISNIGTSVGSISWVVDPVNHDRLVPVGCVGELLIEGPILARGYLNRPEQTAKAFVENPQWALLDPHGADRGCRRMYKTGDLVRYDSDGSLVYLGRKDTQIKLHGQRIELGEVEHHAAAALPDGVPSCVELVQPGDANKSLAVFFAPSHVQDAEAKILAMTPELQTLLRSAVTALASKLASYMVPALFFPVSKMPLTSSGKTDRRRLRGLLQVSPLDMAAYRPKATSGDGRKPETERERTLQKLWAKALDVPADDIAADDSFFRHGGDSIGAMKLAAAARQVGLVLTVATIFQTPRLCDMALAVGGEAGDPRAAVASVPEPVKPFSLLKGDGANVRDRVASICRVRTESVEDIYPCTALQAGLVAASQRQPGAYVAVNAHKLPAGTDVVRFKQAWQDVVDSEAILRTRVVFDEHLGFLQVVVREPITWVTAPSLYGLSADDKKLPAHDGGPLTRYALVDERSDQPTFVWIAHHALYDGWSLSTLLSRVEEQYRRPETAMAATPSYSRFVQHLAGIDTAASDEFWKATLSMEEDVEHFPRLPHSRYHVKASSQVHQTVRFQKPQVDLPVASFLRAAWAMALSTHVSSPDVIFGEVLSGRDVPVPHIEELVGPTLTTVPRRITINSDTTVKAALDMAGGLSAVIPHQFSGLQRIKTLSSSAAAACELQNLLVIQLDDGDDESCGGASLWSNLVSGGNKQGADFFNYPLNVTCTIGRNDTVEVHAYFDDQVLPAWQARSLLGQLEAALARLADTGTWSEKIGELDLLAETDKQQIRKWNATPGPVVDRRIQDVILERNRTRGADEDVVVGWDGTLTATALDHQSSALACHLQDQGVRPATFVPFCLEKSVHAVVAMLAILRAGAAFVPLDPSHPVARLGEIVADCQASVVLCSPQYAERCAEAGAEKVVPIDGERLRKLELKSAMDRGDEDVPSTSPAYAIFTSGTSGKPKGTIVSHLAFCSGAAAHGPLLHMNPPFRFLQFASFTFDASLLEILTTLMRGGTVCVPRDQDRTNGDLAAAMERMEVDMALLTPSFARTIAPSDVPHLKTLILGGEAMAQSHVDVWASRVTLVNAYGPSEAAVVATVNPRVHPSSNPANLGRGVGRCWVVDRASHNRLAPVGAVGELLIEGPILASAYLNNPVKTREVFIHDPAWSMDETFRFNDATTSRRMYKTGDLVRICDPVSGEMLYMGRKDTSQAKVNGQRLELDEISAHLGADPVVQHAAVVLPKEGPCAKRLVAVLALRGLSGRADQLEVVISQEASRLLSQAQHRLAETVPPYMVPTTWLAVNDMPLLPSGKLDRLRVARFIEAINTEILDQLAAAPSHDDKALPHAETQPDTSERLRAIWSQVLNVGLERIGQTTSFLHLGGDSITAMQVMARCRSQNLTVAVSDIINAKSVDDLALKTQIPKAIETVGPVEEDHLDFDPTPIQQLYLQLSGTGSSTAPAQTQFNQSVLLRVANNRADPQTLAKGVHALVQAHPMLRARFRLDDTRRWRQRVTTDVSGSYRFKTHSVDTMQRVQKRMQASQKALNITRGPLIAADYFTVGETGEAYMFVTIHHAVVDIVSWGILLQDLQDFLVSGDIARPLSTPFPAWARAQSARAMMHHADGRGLLPHQAAPGDDGYGGNLAYWGMAGVPNIYGDALAIETKVGSEATGLLVGAECHAAMQTDALDVLLAALLVSFRAATEGREGVSRIFNEGHGREPWDDKMELSRTVGWFTTLYPVHLPEESGSDNDLINAVRWVKDFRRRLSGNGRDHFACSIAAQGRETVEQRWPVEVMFNYLGQMQQLQHSDHILTTVDGVDQELNSASDIGKDVPRFALIEVSAAVTGGETHLSFAFNSRMQHQEQIKAWAEGCRSLLEDAPRLLLQQAQVPQTTLSAFPLLPLTYYGYENLRRRLEGAKILVEDLQDIYPSSPTQRGLLLSQIRDSAKYAYRTIFEVSCPANTVDVMRLCDAWQAVVQRHASLRTVFVDTVGDEGLQDQAVLRDTPGRILLMDSKDQEEAVQTLETLNAIDYTEKKPPHRLTICTTSSGSTLCRLDISHAICDGTSLPILLDDLLEAYDGSLRIQKPTPLYRDYIVHLQSRPRGDSVQYWKEHLAGAEPCLFPSLTDARTRAEAEATLGSHTVTLSDALQITEYCADAGITLSALLQFAWGIVLRTYTGSDDVLFGFLSSGRDVPVPHVEHAVGAFINMLVCRLRLGAETEITDALESTHADVAQAMAHQACSLAEMQHELGLSGETLFNTAFTYQRRSASSPASRPADLQYRILSAEDPSEYAVTVNVEATGHNIEVDFNYWRTVVSDVQIKSIAGTFCQVLADLVHGDEDRTVGELDLVGPHDIRQLEAWNDFALPNVDECIHDIVARHARQQPFAPAIQGWDASFTYRQLDDTANTLAKHLTTLGVGPESFVPLCFEKTAWTIVAQLAVLKAGGAFVGLDPDHPTSRLEQLIQDVGATVVLCSAKHHPKMVDVAKTTATCLVVNAASIASLSATATQQGETQVSPANAAYIIFTSGTTGKPKATVIEHAAFCTGATDHAKAMFMGPDSRVLQFASPTFDASVMEIFSCLLVGGCVCVPSDAQRINDLPGVVRDMGVTWTLLTPSVASTLKPGSAALRGLKTLVTGGEAMTADHITRWASSETKCALVNAYGPTETSVVATTSVKVDQQGVVRDTNSSNIGSAVGGRVWIVDPQDFHRLVPVGAVGELVVEGRLVARGYLNNEEQTRRAFIDAPTWMHKLKLETSDASASAPGRKLYRTGDLVRYNADGSILYMARKDKQVKLNGRRIELGEIEFYCRFPEGTNVSVEVVKPSGTSTSILAVFFTPPTVDATIGDFNLLPLDDQLIGLSRAMEKSASEHLPGYMMPQVFFPVTAMPCTTSGKLDRRQLQQAAESLSRDCFGKYKLPASTKEATATARDAATDMEKTLQGLWEAVLGLPAGSVRATDSFFRVGGDSLTAMRLVGAARARRIALSVLDIFEKPVLSDMAASCGEADGLALLGDADPKLFELLGCSPRDTEAVLREVEAQCLLPREQIQDAYPCSPLQEGFVALASSQAGAYVSVNTLELDDSIDLAKFKAAWQKVVDDTDTLRTRIVHTTTTGFVQAVAARSEMEWFDEPTLECALEEGRRIGAQSGGALTRYAIVEGDQGRARQFVWAIHHALYDGWSLPRLVRQVQDVYNNLVAGKPVESCEAPSYAGFIRHLKDRDTAASEQYWKRRLHGVSAVTHFPQLPATRETARFQMARHQVPLNRRDLQVDATLPSVVRAAWAVVLSAYTGTDDVVFGETLAGRNIALTGVGDMTGPTITTVPTRVQTTRSTLVRDFLRSVHLQATNVVPHQHFGLQHIRRLDQDCEAACGFKNILVIQASSFDADEDEQDDWDFQGASSMGSFFTHPVVLETAVTDAGVEILLHHDETVMSMWQAERLVHQLEWILKELVRHSGSSETRLSDLHVISPDDHALISQWNGGDDQEVAVDACIHDLFLRQAAQTPQKAAISAWDGELTYSQVRDYALRLAHHLRAHGVEAGDFVPVCLTRSAWAVVALFGILLSGAAFVPLDPAHPLARQKGMLDRVSPRLIICSPEHSSRFAGVVDVCVALDGAIFHSLPKPPAHAAPPKCSPSSTAYVLFTSGSTGEPKGVVCTHRAFSSSSAGYTNATKMVPASRVFHFASLVFDVALMEVLSPLTMGACVCVPSEHDRLHDLGGAITRQRATWAFLTPSVANLLDPEAVCAGGAFRTLVCGGEAMQSETVARWAHRLELINGYGPTENSVLSMVNPRVKTQADRAVIGRATRAGRAWIVEPLSDGKPEQSSWLTPVGAAGELAISGPLLAEGYLNDAAKTSLAFVDKPAWASSTAPNAPQRIYRTGDLVKYAADGSLIFLGRRDGQVKVNGQRLELGEIESKLSADPRIRLALVLKPSAGPCKDRLTGVVTLQSTSGAGDAGDAIPLLLSGPPEAVALARKELRLVRDALGEALPAYMVPTSWVVLRDMPIVVSGKLDRKKVAGWVDGLEEKTYEKIVEELGLNDDGEDDGVDFDEAGLAEVAAKLREIWAKELHLQVEKVTLDRGFLGLGGDSIRAMGVISRARTAGISITLQDILRSKSVGHLAKLAKVAAQADANGNDAESTEPFGLSPVQTMYMGLSSAHVGDSRFNQSVTLKVAANLTVDQLKQALNAVVNRHGMLRARFRKDGDSWVQRTVPMNASSYAFESHRVESLNKLGPLMTTAQTGLDIVNGPVFRADFFQLADQNILGLVGQHLVIDIVSWRIILQDLNQVLETGLPLPERPLTFASWLARQRKQTMASNFARLLPFAEPPCDMKYWGIKESPTYGGVETATFSIDERLTRLALDDCHRAFKTKPEELFLAAIVHSFAVTFPDRNTPAVHVETHGREAPADSNNLDLSQTVGWFTSICPLHIQGGSTDILDTLRRIKDTRRSVPENGRPYFANKYLGQSARNTRPMEILFNYLGGGVGNADPNASSDVPLQNIDLENAVADVGPKTTRLALFEISTVVTNNTLQFSFMFDKSLERVPDIKMWIDKCRQTLESMLPTLLDLAPQPTLSDYPLLSLTYDDLHTLTSRVLPRAGIDFASAQIQDIYPCTPVQEGILISQLRNPDAYQVRAVYHVRHSSGPVSLERLAKAWKHVVDRHAGLRTVFVEGIQRGSVFDQVVLEGVDCEVDILRGDTDEQVQLSSSERKPRLPHKLTIACDSAGRVTMRLNANHAILDGGSLALIIEELTLAYANTLSDSPGPLYSDYIRYSTSTARNDKEYWRGHLAGVTPCYFPKLSPQPHSKDERALRALDLPFGRFPELRRLSEQTSVTLANVVHAAWAIVLRKYTASEDTSFGYLTTDRDAPLKGIDRTVGTLINMLCFRSIVPSDASLEDVLASAQDRHIRNAQYRRCSLASVQHELGLAGKALYNTSISIQNHMAAGDAGAGEEKAGLVFEMQEAHDPSEYAVTVNVDTSSGTEGVVLRYWSDHLGHDQAQEVANTLAQVLSAFIEDREQSVADLEARLDGQSQTLPAKAVQTEEKEAVVPTSSTQHLDFATHFLNESFPDRSPPSSRTSSEIHTSGSGSNSTIFDSEPTEPEDAGVPTRRNIRAMLLALWQEMLNLPTHLPISADDSFFDLGGDSIVAMKFAGEARDRGVQLNVADVFRNPTFGAMLTLATEFIREPEPQCDKTLALGSSAERQLQPTDSETQLYERFSLLAASNVDSFLQTTIVPHVGVFRGGLADVLPATDFQALAVTGALLSSRWMLNYFYLDGCGALAISRLRNAWFQVVQAFDILRTVFVPSGGRFLQVVLRTSRPSFRVVKVDDDNFDAFTDDLQAREREAANAPRLGESLLAFTVVMHRHSQRHRLLLRISHAQYDGVCLHRIWAALQDAYMSRGIPAPPLFANYLRASAGALSSEHYRHWSTLLKGSQMTEIVAKTIAEGETLGVESLTSLPTMTLKRKIWLPTVANSPLTPATVIKTAWARVLRDLSGSDDVVFGHTISGRNVSSVSGVEAIVGPCLNLVPVRVRFGAATARELMHAIQTQQVADMLHEVLGFREIIRHCTDWAPGCYFSTAVQYQNGSLDAYDSLAIGGVEYTVGCATQGGGDFADLSVFAQPLAGESEGKGKKEGGMHEIMVSFAEGRCVSRELAQRALDLLCETAELFATEPDAEIPASASPTAQQHQESCLPPNTRTNNSGPTRDSRAPVNPELAALIRATWQKVLSPPASSHTTGADTVAASALDINDNTSFFAAGGDLVRLAELAWLLAQEGVAVPSLEELAARPTVRDQAAFLGPLFAGTVRSSVVGAEMPGLGGAEKGTGFQEKEKSKPAALRRVVGVLRLAKRWTRKAAAGVDVEAV